MDAGFTFGGSILFDILIMFRSKKRRDKSVDDVAKYSSSSFRRVDLPDRPLPRTVLFQCQVYSLGRMKFCEYDMESETRAETFMNQVYDKKQSPCQILCLRDRVQVDKNKIFGISIVSQSIFYKNITHVYIFLDKPDALMLHTQDTGKLKQNFEAFRFLNIEDGKFFQQLLCKSINTPEISDRAASCPAVSRTTPLPQSGENRKGFKSKRIFDEDCYSTMRNESPITDFQEILNSYYSDDRLSGLLPNPIIPAERKDTQTAPVSYSEKKMSIPSNCIEEIPSTSNNYGRTAQMLCKSAENNTESDSPGENLIYIRSNGRDGPVVCESGPIYLYCARYPTMQ